MESQIEFRKRKDLHKIATSLERIAKCMEELCGRVDFIEVDDKEEENDTDEE